MSYVEISFELIGYLPYGGMMKRLYLMLISMAVFVLVGCASMVTHGEVK